MLYNYIILDSANLFHRVKKNSKTSLEIAKKMINYIEGEVKPRLDHSNKIAKDESKVFILFDPISYSDLGESKNFYHNINSRQVILPDYKAQRIHVPLYLETIELFRKYYLYKGPLIQLVYSDEYEADDFVQPLIERCMKPHDLMSYGVAIALCTTDYDWASYISMSGGRQVHMINSSFDKPFTISEFEQLFDFKPTIASNTMYKALIGDKSDNITGVIYMKKVKFNVNVKLLCRNYFQYLANNGMTLDEAIDEFKSATFAAIQKKPDKNAFDELYLVLSIVDLKLPVLEKLYTNIKVIKSALSGKNIDKYVHNNPENKTVNDVIHSAIFGQTFSKQFGRP